MKHWIDTHLPTWLWCGLAIVTTTISFQTMAWLNGLYETTAYPVSFMAGQTTFNAPLLKSYWAVMIELGTLDQYRYVQQVDFLFMMTVFISFTLLGIAVYRLVPAIRWLKNVAWAFILIMPQAASFDALENLVSFIMLANPMGFDDWLVYPYSSFAVAKFAVFSIAYIWIVLALGITAVVAGYRTFVQRRTRHAKHVAERCASA